MNTKPGSPRLFIALVSLSLLLIFFLVWAVIYLNNFAGAFLMFWGVVTVAGLVVLLAFALGLLGEQPLPLLEKLIVPVINWLYPVALTVGRVLGREKDEIRASYIAIHNALAKRKKVKVKPEEVLLLVPHCLQLADCQYKVTNNIENCRQCGRCTINDLLLLKQRYGLNVAVATGGTIARKAVKDYRPKVVIAVACERDLASGIQDVSEIVVIGVTNQRPFGPCYNTTVDIGELEKALANVLAEK